MNQLGPHPPDVVQLIQTLQLNHVFPSNTTQQRWLHQHGTTGNIRAYCRTGNRFARRLRGQDLIYLALFRIFLPKASAAEVNAFLYNMNLGNREFSFYSPSQITKAEQMIGLSRKRGSTTAYQAFLPINMQKRWNYWNLPYPLGMADVQRSKIIDLDECGIFLDTGKRKYGKAYSGVRVGDVGPYSKSEKYNLIMAICGEDGDINQASRRWTDCWLDGGTTVAKMLQFIQMVLEDIGPAVPDNFYVFTMDNLNAHKNEAVIALIHAYGHGVVYRAPYWAVDAAIEYVFNTLQALLRAKLYRIKNMNDLIAAVYESIQSMIDFSNYFRNVGFIND